MTPATAAECLPGAGGERLGREKEEIEKAMFMGSAFPRSTPDTEQKEGETHPEKRNDIPKSVVGTCGVSTDTNSEKVEHFRVSRV